MLLTPPDRVKQLVTAVGSSPATGQGDLSLGGQFSSDMRTWNTTATSGGLYPYVIKEGAKVEVGYGTPLTGSPWTFQRTTVIWSTAGSATKETFTTACVVWAAFTSDFYKVIDFRGRHAISVGAGAMKAAVTNGATLNNAETTTNLNQIVGWDFNASTVQSVQFSMCMPASYDGGAVRFRLVWKHATTSTNFSVAWRVSGSACGDGDALDVAFGTAVQVNDVGGTAETNYTTAETADITIAGSVQPLDWVHFKIERVATDATNDLLAVNATLVQAIMLMSVNAPTD